MPIMGEEIIELSKVVDEKVKQLDIDYLVKHWTNHTEKDLYDLDMAYHVARYYYHGETDGYGRFDSYYEDCAPSWFLREYLQKTSTEDGFNDSFFDSMFSYSAFKCANIIYEDINGMLVPHKFIYPFGEHGEGVYNKKYRPNYLKIRHRLKALKRC